MITKEQRELRERFLGALESGQYKQTDGALRKGDCFCVVGVACDLIDPQGWREASDAPSPYFQYTWRGSRSDHAAYRVADALGLRDSTVDKMMLRNDISKHTFPQIAQWLREVFPQQEA